MVEETFDASRHFVCVWRQAKYNAVKGKAGYFETYADAKEYASNFETDQAFIWISERGNTPNYRDEWFVLWWSNAVDEADDHKERPGFGKGYLSSDTVGMKAGDEDMLHLYEPLDPQWRSRHNAHLNPCYDKEPR